MTWSATEEYNTGASHSQVSLRNPHKEKQIKRLCNSEPFLKPLLSLKNCTPWKLVSYLKSMGPICKREEETVVLQDLYKPKKVQLSITDNSIKTLPKEKKSEFKRWIRREQRSEKAAEIKSGALQTPRIAWESITTPSAKVILDPNTANPTLKLSVDGCSVRTKTHKEFHSSQSYHEYQRKYRNKYDGWMCVQAQEGYSTGRHYWEVDVQGKSDWRIGVVKESAPRTGFIKLNTATGYWTLRLQLGSLIALTEPVTKLNQAPPSKIGVHLDVDKHHVSFYDAKKRKEIYTFNTEFSKGEKIYPVFGTVETDKPLKII